MKKLIAAVLTLIMLLSFTACGGDPNAGVYNAVSCEALGFSMDCDGDWLELKSNGKGKLCLMGEKYNCSWTLEGEKITVKNHGDEFYGTLHNGMITLDLSGMVYVYRMDAITEKDGTVRGHVHQWKPADCVNPETCEECGEVQGEVTGHDSTQPNHQDPAICKICGEITGDKLVPEMAEYGFTEFMEVGVVYPFEMKCADKPHLTSMAEVTVTSYEIFESGEGYPAREGYEWRVATIRIRAFDDYAYEYGVGTSCRFEDYYNTKLHDDSSPDWEQYGDDENSYFSNYKLLYHGEEMDAYERYTDKGWTRWRWTQGNDRGFIRTVTAAYQVPIGYDGVVVGFYDAYADPENAEYILDYDPAICMLFRMK